MFALLNRLVHGAEQHRAYFYRLATVLGAVLVGAHFITGGALSTVLSIVGAVLGVGGTGLASANTSTKKPNQAGAVNLGGLIQVLIGALVILAILWFLGLHVRIN